jgi:hypothetical protein
MSDERHFFNQCRANMLTSVCSDTDHVALMPRKRACSAGAGSLKSINQPATLHRGTDSLV